MKILVVGDVYSKLGRKSLEENIKKIKAEEKINFVIVNGENISHGKGMNFNHYKWLLSIGANVVTMGNHTWHNAQIYDFIDSATNIVRPYNYKKDMPGKGYVAINYNGIKIIVFQIMGTTFINEELDNPFLKTEELLREVAGDIYICDFHAEATSEKIAFGLYFDGKIDVIFGTHTHVQTNDARLLPEGSAYITDVGMTGPLDGVIGTRKEVVFSRFISGTHAFFTPLDEGRTQFCAIIAEIDEKTLKPCAIRSIRIID